jgi:hypothetical protein
VSDPLVSACLIVRDEAENLPRCLNSLRSLADQVVVVDTGSTDDTIAVARELGAEVCEEPWRDDFSLHRNQAIERAKGKWILIIDADEELQETDTGETRERLEADGLPDILLATLKLRYPGGRTVSLLAPRLLRRSAGIRYIHPVHEQLDVEDASALVSNLRLLHHGYADPAKIREKEHRNLRLAEAGADGSPHLLHCVVRSAFSLKEWDKAADAALRSLGRPRKQIAPPRWSSEPSSSSSILDDALASPPVLLLDLSPESCTIWDNLFPGTPLSIDMPPLLAEEVSALGAAAALRAGNDEAMDRLIGSGAAISPESPDVRLMAALAAVGKYLHTLRDGDSTSGQVYVRPPIFHHDAAVARRALEALLFVAQSDRNPGSGE